MTIDLDLAAVSRRRTTVRRLGWLTVATIMVIAVVLGGNRWTHPTVFDGDDQSSSLFPRPLSTFPVRIGLALSDVGTPRETITLTGLRPRFADGSIPVTTTFVICRERPVARGSLTLGTIDGTTSLSKFCTSVRSYTKGAHMLLDGTRGDYLVATLTPTRTGRAHLVGLDISYARGGRHLFQRGTQHLDEDLSLTAR